MNGAPPTRRARELPWLERLGLLLVVSIWVILQNNARISDNLPDDAGFSLIQIPRASRVIEAAVLVAMFAVHQGALVRSRLWDFAALVWMFVLVSLVSVALAPRSLVSQLQGIYVYVSPFLLFGWAVSSAPTPRMLHRLFAIFSAYLALCVSVALFVQLPVLRVRSDLIHGLFSDAHVLGAFLALFSCVAFSRFMAAGGLRTLLLAVALFLVSYFPANQKMIVFNLAWWAGVVLWRLIRHPGSRRGLTIAAAACGVVWWFAVATTDAVADWLLVSPVTEWQPGKLGPVQSWVRAGYIVLDSPSALIVGIGPGNYAGVAAARAVHDEPAQYMVLSARARATLLDEAREQEGGIGWVTNTWSNLLAEFGAVGFLLFGTALLRLSWPILRWRPATPRDKLARTTFIAGLGAILWQGCITPYTNWSEPILAYPLMVVAAYCYNTAIAEALSRLHSRAARRIADRRDGALVSPLVT